MGVSDAMETDVTSIVEKEVDETIKADESFSRYNDIYVRLTLVNEFPIDIWHRDWIRTGKN